ncbi:MAG: HEPN domain-containing protein, partial [archaeon]
MAIDNEEEFKKWFRQAEADFTKIKILIDSNNLDGAAFYSQQSVEKALKALIIKTKKQLPRIHDLLSLSKMADCPEEIIDKCKIINPYYIETR